MTLHVDSEVGRLRQAILHRPDLELKRLTPTNHDEYLFDDVLWVKHAKQEHDAFAETLRDLDVEVLLLDQLLRETVAIPEARKYILEESLDERVYGPMALDSLYSCFESLGDAALTQYLVGGMTKRELLERVPEPSSVVVQALEMDDLLLSPLPNHMFTRDTSAWVYDGVSINSMRKRARTRETIHYEAIYRWHPHFADAKFNVWAEGSANGMATTEGGDILVLGRGAVLVGMSERTTPQGVERLARKLFAAGSATRIVALTMPKKRAFMHLDTVMTMVNEDTFTKYVGLGMLPSCTIEPGDGGHELKVTTHPAGAHALRDRRCDGTGQHQRPHRHAGRPRRRARAVGRRMQRPGRAARRRRRLRTQRHHQHLPAQERHRGGDHPGQRARPRPWRPPMHDLPHRTRRDLSTMAFNLRNRSFLKELDFTPKEWEFLFDRSAALKQAKYAGSEQPRLSGKNLALIFDKTASCRRPARGAGTAGRARSDVRRSRSG